MTQADIESLREHVRSMTAAEVLQWAQQRYGDRVALASSLGAEDQVLLHMVATNAPGLRAFTLDTGRLFPETYDVLRKSAERYPAVPISVFFPDAPDVERMVTVHGIDLFRDSVDARKLCCEMRKVRPLRRALAGLDAWITGLRAEQSPTRDSLEVIDYDEANGLFRIAPLASWSEDDVWDYIRQHDIPVNALHERGFPSIGCAPCTRAIQPGEDVRAGRWWWESPEHKECGLHSRAAGVAPQATSHSATEASTSDEEDS